jgi:Domain of unknown function (DUF4157)
MAVHAEPQRRSREPGAEHSPHPGPPAAQRRDPAEPAPLPQHDDAASGWQPPQLRTPTPGGSGIVPQAVAFGTGGQPLDPWTRTRMESRFGSRFEHVRIHHDGEAARAAGAVDARAFTVGAHIFFAPREYAPRTVAGRRLLAHELAHVRQHDRGRTTRAPGSMSAPSDGAEHEARTAAVAAITGGRPRITSSVPASTICRQEGTAPEPLPAAPAQAETSTATEAPDGQEELVTSVAGVAILADLYAAQVMWPDDKGQAVERLQSARTALLDVWSPLMDRVVDEFSPMPDEAFVQRFPELSVADDQVHRITTMIDDLSSLVDHDSFDVEADAVIAAQILPALITIEPLLQTIDRGPDAAFQILTAESRSQFTDDLLASVKEAPTHAPGLVDEYLQEHFTQIILMMYLWLYLQAAIWVLGPASIVAYVLQLVMLIAFGLFFAVEAAGAYDEATTWLDLSGKANGDPAQISAASKALCRMFGHIGMAILSARGMRRPTAMPGSRPTGGVRPHGGIPEGSQVVPHPDQPGVDLILPPARTTPAAAGATTSTTPSSPNLPAAVATTAATARQVPRIVRTAELTFEARDPATGIVAGSGGLDAGFIVYKIDVTKAGVSVSGSDVFHMIHDAFDLSGASFEGVVGVWTNQPGLGRNLTDFNRAVLNGKTHEKAAWETWTGEQCLQRGYNKVDVVVDRSEVNLDGTVQGATVYFSRE